MIFLPWRPTSGEAFAGPEVFVFSNSVSAAATPVDVTFVNDTRQLVALYTAYADYTSGAGQNITARQLSLMKPDGTIAVNFRGDFTALGAGASAAIDWAGFMIVLPRWRVRARGNWNAGAAANTTQLQLTGVWLPRGNVLG